MSVTLTTNHPPIKYIKRPRPEGRLYGCDHCSTHIVLYVRPIEVLHKCLRTRKTARLTERT